MHLMIRNLLIAGVVALIAAAPARAGLFSLTVQETGGAAIVIDDNASPLDLDPLVGIINVDSTALNLLLTEFQFASLSSASNAEAGTPFSNDVAALVQTGVVFRVGTSGVATMSVTATDNDYNFPVFNPKFLGTGATDIFTFTSAGDNRTFQSFFDPGNSPGATTIPSPVLAFPAPAGTGPFASSGTDLTALGVQPIPFALTNTTLITLGPNVAFSRPPRDQFSGATIVTAIPEPSAGVLAALALPLLALYGLRKRRALA